MKNKEIALLEIEDYLGREEIVNAITPVYGASNALLDEIDMQTSAETVHAGLKLILTILRPIVVDSVKRGEKSKAKILALVFNSTAYIHNELGAYIDDPVGYHQKPIPDKGVEFIELEDIEKGTFGDEEENSKLIRILEIILSSAEVIEPILTKVIKGKNQTFFKLYAIAINVVIDALEGPQII